MNDIRQLSLEIETKMLNEVAEFIFARACENIVAVDAEELRRLANVNATKRTKYPEGPPTDTGMLMKSGHIERTTDAIIIKWDAPFSAIVEFGRGPGPVPYDVILRWVERKLKVKDAERVAYAIKTSIEKKGFNPKPFLRAAINAAVSKYGKAL